ncbi:MAG: rod shape-determining protein MreD [Acidimicrobiales bacterium]|jgi:rod shape-determining protein MreD|nr:rod shape-determining protein MreD [Acidimicrobiales bacterium]
MTASVYARSAVVLLSVLVLQRGLLSDARIAGVALDLLLLVSLAAGLTGGPDRGAAFGFAAGLGMDLLLQGPLGLTALAFCLAGYVAGRYEGSTVRASRWRPVITVGVGSAATYGLYVVLGWVFGQRSMLSDRLWVIVLVVSLVNAIISPLALRVMRWVWHDPVVGRYPAIR